MSSSCSLSSLDRFLFKENDATSTPTGSEEQTDHPCGAILKQCRRCLDHSPLDQFNKDCTKKDGLDIYCRMCRNKAYNEREKKKPQESPGPCEETCDIPEASNEPDSLYVMENPRIPGEIKIGRSQAPEDRAKHLSAGHNFRLIVKYSYGGAGFLERTLHSKLKHLRVDNAAGVEWFRVTAEQADLLIRATILENTLAVQP